MTTPSRPPRADHPEQTTPSRPPPSRPPQRHAAPEACCTSTQPWLYSPNLHHCYHGLYFTSRMRLMAGLDLAAYLTA
jgi:hypothetical protein